jgi:integrase/recombinase XerD
MLDRRPIDQFLAELEGQKGFSANTLSAYRNDLTQFADYLDQGEGAAVKPVGNWRAVGREAIMAFLLYLKERQYAVTTVARKQAAIKSFFKFLVSRGVVPSNPTENLASPHVDRALPQTISEGEVARLLHEMDVAPDSPEVLRDRAMMALLYATGLRVGETVALDVGDVDLKSNTLDTQGRGKTRSVPIGPEASEALHDYLDRGRPVLVRGHSEGASLAREASPGDSGALFLNHRGQRLTRQGFWLILKRYAKSAGLGDISPHTLRHSFAAQKLDSGTDMRDLQRILGHANISTTQVYARIGRKEERNRSGAPQLKRNAMSRG